MAKLFIAKSAGFCFGVKRAVEMAETALAEGKRCCCLGELIHNRAVVEALAAKGLKTVEAPDEVTPGEAVIIRSHGTGRETYEALKARGADIIDATCPRVRHIHEIVSKASEQGRRVIIIGSADHPEVMAIRGWCEESEVFSDVEALQNWLEITSEVEKMPLTMVSQTTQTKNNLQTCANLLKKVCTNAEIFDTICGATATRQEEAAKLAAQCDAMIVIGGKHSANSIHLAEICRESCARVQFIENGDELDVATLGKAEKIGLTAGASAPEWTIKEVINKMSEETKIEEMTEEQSFAEMLEASIKTIHNGDTVSGVVAAITPTEVTVDLGTKHSGYIPLSEFTDDPSVKVEDVIKVGDTIEACAVRVNDVEGTVMLSKKRLDAVKNWSDIEAAQEDGNAVEGVVTEENKGGVVVSVHGIRVFVPASQTGLGKDAPMSELLKKTVRLKITEVNRSRRRVVGSIRAIQYKERKEKSEKIWNEIEVGKRYDGVVKSLTSYGAFVDIGGIDGMVHVSELSWSRIRQPSDVVAVGDPINVYVINFDREKRKISLGYRDPNENPWAKFTAAYEVGSVAKVKIVKLMQFGAFAEVLPGVDGLIHISQIADRRIGKPDEVLTVGDEVEAKITAIDEEKHKISLSIRALIAPEAPKQAPVEEEAAPVEEAAAEDALVYEVSADGTATGVAPEVEE